MVTAEKIPGTRAVAQRIVNAENGFVATVIDRISCTETEARKVLAVYRKARVIVLDAVGGTYTVKHGAYWDRDVLLRAVTS